MDQQYMSQSEYESEVLHNFELNSNTSLTMLPNHGYTSGFTDGIQSRPQKRVSGRDQEGKRTSRVLVDEDRKIIEEAMKSKPSSKGSGAGKKSQRSYKNKPPSDEIMS